jgi:hypothetical protein
MFQKKSPKDVLKGYSDQQTIVVLTHLRNQPRFKDVFAADTKLQALVTHIQDKVKQAFPLFEVALQLPPKWALYLQGATSFDIVKNLEKQLNSKEQAVLETLDFVGDIVSNDAIFNAATKIQQIAKDLFPLFFLDQAAPMATIDGERLILAGTHAARYEGIKNEYQKKFPPEKDGTAHEKSSSSSEQSSSSSEQGSYYKRFFSGDIPRFNSGWYSSFFKNPFSGYPFGSFEQFFNGPDSKKRSESSSSAQSEKRNNQSTSSSQPKPPLATTPEEIQQDSALKDDANFLGVVKLFNTLQGKHKNVSQNEAERYLFEALHASNIQETRSAYKKLVVKIHPDKITRFKEPAQEYLNNLFKFVSHYYDLANNK